MSDQAVLDRAPVFRAERLRAARMAAGLKQREMAEHLGHSLRHYQYIEAGHSNPSAVQLGVFAHLLGVSIDSLYSSTRD